MRRNAREELAVIEERRASLTKSHRRSKLISGDVSCYTLQKAESEPSTTYRSIHRTTPYESGSADLSRAGRYLSGGCGIIKPLSPVAPVADDAPAKIALKCLNPPDDDRDGTKLLQQYHNTQKACETMTAWGFYAECFIRNGKVFMAMDWIGYEDLFDYLKPRAYVEPHILILALFQALERISVFHRLHNKGIADIKPENFRVVARSDGYIDLVPIDLDGAFQSPPIMTPVYIHPKDRSACFESYRRHDKSFEFTPDVDFRSMAILFALMIAMKAAPGKASLVLNEKPVRIDGQSLFLYNPEKYTNPIYNVAETPIIHELYDSLSEGKNPFSDPSPNLMHYMFEHDLARLQNAIQCYMVSIRHAASSVYPTVGAGGSGLFTVIDKTKQAIGILKECCDSLSMQVHDKPIEESHILELHRITEHLLKIEPNVHKRIMDQCFCTVKMKGITFDPLYVNSVKVRDLRSSIESTEAKPPSPIP